jgi:hypothetical protein
MKIHAFVKNYFQKNRFPSLTKKNSPATPQKEKQTISAEDSTDVINTQEIMSDTAQNKATTIQGL